MRRRRFLATGLTLSVMPAVVSKALAQDKKTRTVNGGGLTFEVPETWKSGRPASSMRRAQLAIPAAKGDKEDGECVLFAFPGGAGSVEDNIDRWAGQFRTEEDAPPKPVIKKVKGKNADVTRVEISGRYVAPLAPGNPQTVNKPAFMLLGAIVVAPEVSYFLKATGPEATMKAAAAEFDALIASMTLGG